MTKAFFQTIHLTDKMVDKIILAHQKKLSSNRKKIEKDLEALIKEHKKITKGKKIVI